MIRSEVQRTLVKSPPELWAEISDPEALARHLGEFGEIRITRVQPEQQIEWAAAEASGSVIIKPSGWGTKVKLTVERELASADAQADAPEAEADPAAEVEPETETEMQADMEAEEVPITHDVGPAPLDAEDEPDLQALSAEADSAIEAEAFDDHEPEEPAPQPRRGFLARLFGRRRARRQEPSSTPTDAHLPEPPAPLDCEIAEQAISEQPESEQSSTTQQPEAALADEHNDDMQTVQAPEVIAVPSLDTEPEEPVVSTHSGAQRIAAELEAAEAVAAEQVTAVLTGVLDSLGSAHHRPFSRA
ncbi:MAG TPA: hypothetical protein VGI52_02520 [Solirubrobacteraceae bacterium]|jgi:hypothetical protein